MYQPSEKELQTLEPVCTEKNQDQDYGKTLLTNNTDNLETLPTEDEDNVDNEKTVGDITSQLLHLSDKISDLSDVMNHNFGLIETKIQASDQSFLEIDRSISIIFNYLNLIQMSKCSDNSRRENYSLSNESDITEMELCQDNSSEPKENLQEEKSLFYVFQYEIKKVISQIQNQQKSLEQVFQTNMIDLIHDINRNITHVFEKIDEKISLLSKKVLCNNEQELESIKFIANLSNTLKQQIETINQISNQYATQVENLLTENTNLTNKFQDTIESIREFQDSQSVVNIENYIEKFEKQIQNLNEKIFETYKSHSEKIENVDTRIEQISKDIEDFNKIFKSLFIKDLQYQETYDNVVIDSQDIINDQDTYYKLLTLKKRIQILEDRLDKIKQKNVLRGKMSMISLVCINTVLSILVYVLLSNLQYYYSFIFS